MSAYARYSRAACVLSFLLALPIASQADAIADLKAAWAKYDASRDSDDAAAHVEAAREVLDVGRDVLPAGDERLPILMLNYAKALNRALELPEAREAAEEALAAAEAIYSKDSIDLLDYWITLGDIFGSLRSESLQSRAYRKALKLVAGHHGKESEAYGDLAMDAGFKLFVANRSNRSSRLFRQSITAYETSLGATSPKTIAAGLSLGRVEYQLGNYAVAEKQLSQGLPTLVAGGPELAESEMKVRALLVQILERQGKSEAATEHCVAIGRLSSASEDTEFQPLYREAPRYPISMLQTGTQGHVDMEFTVDESGFVRDVVILNTVTKRPKGRKRIAGNATSAEAAAAGSGEAFEAAALAAVSNFRYAPRIVDGEATATTGVTTRITFRIE